MFGLAPDVGLVAVGLGFAVEVAVLGLAVFDVVGCVVAGLVVEGLVAVGLVSARASVGRKIRAARRVVFISGGLSMNIRISPRRQVALRRKYRRYIWQI
jgi:hypothetical protein